jgi:hypothetical protein
MGKRSKDADEASEVETITALPGPLAPWRLVLCVALAAVTTGMPLMAAARTGVGLDMALLRSFGIAFVAWVALGKINRVLGQAATDKLREPAPRLQAVPDLRPTTTQATTAPAAPSATTDHEDAGRAA